MKAVISLLFGLALLSICSAGDHTGEKVSVTLLNGKSVSGLLYKTDNRTLRFQTLDGVSAVNLSELSDVSLKEHDMLARDHDAQFWWERAQYAKRAHLKDSQVAGLSNHRALIAEFQNLIDKTVSAIQEEQRQAAMNQRAAFFANLEMMKSLRGYEGDDWQVPGNPLYDALKERYIATGSFKGSSQ